MAKMVCVNTETCNSLNSHKTILKHNQKAEVLYPASSTNQEDLNEDNKESV